jgi:hypothetical protein
MKKRLIYIILILSIMMFTFGRGSTSWFMSTAESGGNTFSVGTLEISIGVGDIGTIDLEELVPEKLVEQEITVTNKGTLPCKLYGIEFPRESLKSLSDLEDALKLQICFKNTKDREITALEIPVFNNYIDTILDDLIIFYPIILDDEIQMVFRAELDMVQIEEKHSEVEASSLQFELLASQVDTPLQQLSGRYLFIGDYPEPQTALNSMANADVLIIDEEQYECDNMILQGKENISIVGVWQQNKPEFRYMEAKNQGNNSINAGNLENYFLRVEDCKDVIIRDISLGYYKKNTAYSSEAKVNGPKPKKPLFINGCFNYVSIDLKGEFKKNQADDKGRENIILVDGEGL